MPKPILTRSLRRLLPFLLLTAAPAVLAQSPYGATVQPLPRANDPAELLAQALRTLAVEPSNLSALEAAGHNALLLGDPNAAVGFFGRAQEIAPRDGHVKAGLGSALVELEKPQDALRLFAEASRLGVPDDEIAEDRGLAYDLTGDPRRAQRDYATVLAVHPDNDLVRRRLALSQGISGDKAAAIATLDPLIRKRDIAGWRAQTFVLAMNGDAKGASAITHIMLPQQADMLQPFLVRLAALSPADKARAVNFGEMPAAGRAYTPTELANTGAVPTYGGSATRSATTVAPATTVAAATPGRRPAHVAMAAPTPTPTPASAAPVAVSPAPAATSPAPVVRPPAASAPVTTIAAATPATIEPIASAPAPAATQIVPAPRPQPPVTQPSVIQPPVVQAPAPVAVAQATPAPSVASGMPAVDLPTAAPVGHYDLPHDVRGQGAVVVRAPQAAAPATADAGKTIGTPVVHGKPGRATPPPAPAAIRLAATEETSAPPAEQPKPGRHGKPASPPSDEDQAGKAHKGAHEVATVDTSDSGGKKDRKGAHGKSAVADEDDSGAKTRKGAHGTKLAAADESDDGGSARSRKSAHGRKGADQDSDTGSAHTKKGEKADKSEKAEKSEPERIFVQVAGGANKDDMDKAWAGVKKKAPELMKGRTASTAPVHATNRLLVGPFKSEDEAQAFVNKMAGKGLSGFTVKTGKGQKTEKVDSGQ